MNPLLHLYLPLFVYIHHTTTSIAMATAIPQQTCSGPANIECTCKSVTDQQPDIGYDFCVKSLKAAQTNPFTDLQELAVAVTRLAIAHAASTEAKIEELMNLETDSTIDTCYNTCLDVFTGAIDRMRDALDNLSSQLYGKAVALLTTAVAAAEKCEEAFRDRAKSSFPLVAMDKDYEKLLSIAHGIIVSME